MPHLEGWLDLVEQQGAHVTNDNKSNDWICLILPLFEFVAYWIQEILRREGWCRIRPFSNYNPGYVLYNTLSHLKCVSYNHVSQDKYIFCNQHHMIIIYVLYNTT